MSYSHMVIIELANLMNKRLQMMQDVAIYKSVHHLPVEVFSREAEVIELNLKQARQLGLAPGSVEPFIQAQMDVAKAIQYRYRADFLSTGVKPRPPSTLSSVRAVISDADIKILKLIRNYLAVSRLTFDELTELRPLLQSVHLTDEDKILLSESLARIVLIK